MSNVDESIIKYLIMFFYIVLFGPSFILLKS